MYYYECQSLLTLECVKYNLNLIFHLQKYGKIDVVVSNAAANPSVDSILQTQESVLDKLWDINVKSSILILKVISFNKGFSF